MDDKHILALKAENTMLKNINTMEKTANKMLKDIIRMLKTDNKKLRNINAILSRMVNRSRL